MSTFKTAILLLILLLAGAGTLQAAPTLASTIKAEETDGKPPVLVDGGLLGVLGSSIDEVQDTLGLSVHLLDIWNLRAERAGQEVVVLAKKIVDQPQQSGVGDFFLLPIIWSSVFTGLMLAGKLLVRYLTKVRAVQTRPRVQKLLDNGLPYLLPAVLSLVLIVFGSHLLSDSVGRALGVCLAYAGSSGVFCAALVMSLLAMLDSAHKRPAVWIIRKYAVHPLFMIGFFAALSDGIDTPQVGLNIGANLARCLSILCGVVACTVFAYLVIKLRRPVAHLIRDRVLAQRLGQPAFQESLRIFSVLWYWPILLMLLVSALNLVGVGEGSGRALRSALLTSGLLITTVFLSTVLHHSFTTLLRSHGAYKVRLMMVVYVLLRIALVLAFIELLAQIWGFSVWAFASNSHTGQVISDSLGHILLIYLVTWLAWVVIDTAIQQVLEPPASRRGTHAPSTRIKTILPLIRNAIKVVLAIIFVISTLANLGVNVTPFLAGAGVVGLAIGFGSQQLVQDVITGLFILIEDTISVGDWVEVDSNHAGTVEGLTIRTLRLRDSRGYVHSVPFGQIKAVVNHSRQFAYAFFSIQFTYDTDMDKATDLIHEAGRQISDDPLLSLNLLSPLSVFGVDSMNLDGVTISAQFRTLSGTQSSITRAFNDRLKKLVDKSAQVHFAQHYPQGFMMPVRAPEQPAQPVVEPQRSALLLPDTLPPAP